MKRGNWYEEVFLLDEEVEVINMMRRGFEVEVYPPNKKKSPDAPTSGPKEIHLHLHYNTPEEDGPCSK
ncbi:hypothetical protein [Atopococcus tabaci]|uniref:hypothetical protein n=1 Tax=Atopococcus tabaci TaxID=269774 RepID=UPI002409A181|nr:hypothetical protein [Atopococcus tabaci]